MFLVNGFRQEEVAIKGIASKWLRLVFSVCMYACVCACVCVMFLYTFLLNGGK